MERMDTPVWHWYIRYILEALATGETFHRKEVLKEAVNRAPLTNEQRVLTYEDGLSVSEHRAGWALSALTRAACVTKPSRGYFQINEQGKALLSSFAGIISQKDLEKLPAWNDYVPTRSSDSNKEHATVSIDSDADPMERITSAVQEIEQQVASELLTKLREGSPEFFELAVIELLKAMGYGGVEKRGLHTGKTGDGGIDGVLDQDALGLNRVHVQAKRYGEDNTIGRPDIQQFVGALGDKGASQGVYVTSSRFSKEARETAERAREKIALIDGNRLVELMIKYKVGVQAKQVFTVFEIDEDFFD